MNYIPTKLYAVPQTTKTAWTLLDIPHRPDLPDFGRVVSSELKLRTIDHVKNNTRGWTVGPLDFCGHGRVFRNGASEFVSSLPTQKCCLKKYRFVALCVWHPALTTKQNDIQTRSWKAKGIYKPGIRKLALADIPGEAKWRTKHVKALNKRVVAGDFPGVQPPLPTDFVDTQLRLIRATERNHLALVAGGIVKQGRKTTQSKIRIQVRFKKSTMESGSDFELDLQTTRAQAVTQRQIEIKKLEANVRASEIEIVTASLDAEKVVHTLVAHGYTLDLDDIEKDVQDINT